MWDIFIGTMLAMAASFAAGYYWPHDKKESE